MLRARDSETMTVRREAPIPDALRFLVEDFIEVGEKLPETDRFQREAARILLPGPQAGPYSLQQLAVMGMRPADFHRLRREVRDWLQLVVSSPATGHPRRLNGPLIMWLESGAKTNELRAPRIEGSALEVFWFYVVHLVSRAGLDKIGICHAPKSMRAPGQRNLELRGETEPCDRLFLRRGDVKEFCSETCRARVATQRARGIESTLVRRTGRRRRS
jgi:hypothetical protein